MPDSHPTTPWTPSPSTDAEQSERQATLGYLFGTVAHEFRKYLEPINLNLNLAAETPLTPQQVADMSATLKQAYEFLNVIRQMIWNNLGPVRPVPVRTLLDHLTPTLRRILGPEITLELPPEGDERIQADPYQLEQIIVYLTRRARRAMPGGGRFTVALGRRTVGVKDMPMQVAPRCLNQEYATLDLTDTGLPIPADRLPHLLEIDLAHLSEDPQQDFELNAVYVILLNRLSGGIKFTPRGGQGTTATLFLPLAEPDGTRAP